MTSIISYDLILRPVVTEKSTTHSESSKYSFIVAPEADKHAVGKAIADIFNVEVKKVNILNRKGKVKMFRHRSGRRSDHKVAIVTVKKGQKIDYGVEV